jgi:hypothetical protein
VLPLESQILTALIARFRGEAVNWGMPKDHPSAANRLYRPLAGLRIPMVYRQTLFQQSARSLTLRATGLEFHIRAITGMNCEIPGNDFYFPQLSATGCFGGTALSRRSEIQARRNTVLTRNYADSKTLMPTSDQFPGDEILIPMTPPMIRYHLKAQKELEQYGDWVQANIRNVW